MHISPRGRKPKRKTQPIGSVTCQRLFSAKACKSAFANRREREAYKLSQYELYITIYFSQTDHIIVSLHYSLCEFYCVVFHLATLKLSAVSFKNLRSLTGDTTCAQEYSSSARSMLSSLSSWKTNSESHSLSVQMCIFVRTCCVNVFTLKTTNWLLQSCFFLNKG